MSIFSVNNLGKAFITYRFEWHRFANWFGFSIKPSEEHWVLRNVSFEIQPGEVIGIIGQNGAGKSTLLKMITGTLKPTEGCVQVNGRIAAILELGMGFNPELTGRQNVYHAAGLMGFSAEQIHKMMPDIEAFSEIGEYFDEPMRTYSSGMHMRVAFSVATAKQPDLLIIDEALSVGDAYFQQKSMKKIFDLKNNGVSIIFVSHDINAVRMLCDIAILIDDGLMIDMGEPKEIVNFYKNIVLKKSHKGGLEFKQEKIKEQEDQKINSPANIGSTGEVELLEFSLRDVKNNEVDSIVSEDVLKICFTVKSCKYLEDPHYGIIIRNKFGLSAFEANTYTMRIETEPLNKDESINIEFSFECNLGVADYSISIGVTNKGYDLGAFEEYLLFYQDLEMIKVIQNSDAILYEGCTNLKPTVKLEKATGIPIKHNIFESQQKYIDTNKYAKYLIHQGYSRPIMLFIETVNICNFDCIICAYSKLSRKKEIMDGSLFKKILSDYNDMGGGNLSLTPVVGEVFLDKDLVSRYKEIKKHPLIADVSFTTNAIKSNNFNDQDLSFILRHTSRIHISVYGIDENENEIMTKRSKYEQVIKSIKRMLTLIDDTNKIVIGFRTLKKYDDAVLKTWISDNFGIDLAFSSTTQYANWGVIDTDIKLPFQATWSTNRDSKKQCLIPLVACQVFVNGEVSFCPCDDFDNDEELHLGSIHNDTLINIYNTNKTKELWNFEEKVPEFCKKCSFYKPLDTIKEHDYIFENPVYFIGG